MAKGSPITPELKAKMAAGRARAAEKRRQLKAREEARERAVIEEPTVAVPIKLPAPPPDDDWYDGLLSDEEKAQIKAEARKKAREDQRKAVAAAYRKEQLDIARRELGEMPPDEEWKAAMEEPCRVYVEMPRMRKPDGKGEHEPEPIIIDQTVYASGRYYDMPRGTAVYLNWLMDQARRHVNQVDGRSRTYFNASMGQMIYQGGIAAGGGMLGQSFDALHKRSA